MTFEQAIEIAARALAGIEDKFGEPELLHTLRVVVVGAAEARVVAALHDVLEDSDLTAEDLKAAGLGEVELEAVKLLTRLDDEPYEEYIEQIATAEGRGGPPRANGKVGGPAGQPGPGEAGDGGPAGRVT